MKAIVKLQLKSLLKLIEDQEMGFIATDNAVDEIVKVGFDPLYGARPLRRAIQKEIENPIAGLIIDKKFTIGDQIAVDFDGENFTFKIQKTAVIDEKSKQKTVKKFTCDNCQNIFETEIIPNSTVLCPKCASGKKIHQ